MITYHPYAESSRLSIMGTFLFDEDLHYSVEDAQRVINTWKVLYPIDKSWIDVYDDDILRTVIYINDMGGEWII